LFPACSFTGSRSTTEVLRYTISIDRIAQVSSLSNATGGGVALSAKDGKSIYYIGGLHTDKAIHKFDPETNVTVRLPAVLPSSVFNGAVATAVSINGTATATSFIYSGYYRSIMEFDMDTETAKIIGELPFREGAVYSTSAIHDGSDKVWVLAGDFAKPSYPVLEFNMTSKVAAVPAIDTTCIPTLSMKPASVWDGQFGYILGGMGRVEESDGNFHPTDGILR
jgi:hypothetical protein